MARISKRRRKSIPLEKLKTALSEIARAAPGFSFVEGESYVCSVCQLPVRLCNADPTRTCAHMLLEGTELRLLRFAAGDRPAVCVRCGDVIPQKALAKYPLRELCPSCRKSSSKPKLLKRSKGASL